MLKNTKTRFAFTHAARWPEMEDAELLETNEVTSNPAVRTHAS